MSKETIIQEKSCNEEASIQLQFVENLVHEEILKYIATNLPKFNLWLKKKLEKGMRLHADSDWYANAATADG